MAPGRTLATMFFTKSDIPDDDDIDDLPSVINSEALMTTPDDTADDRGTVAYRLTDTSLLNEFAEVDDVGSAAEERSSWSELVQRDSDGGHSDREPARQWPGVLDDGALVITSTDSYAEMHTHTRTHTVTHGQTDTEIHRHTDTCLLEREDTNILKIEITAMR